MLCADVVEACWTAKEGQTERANALLEDISPSGACLQFETAVPPGVTLRWRCAAQEFSGQVRYCVYREIGYFVGVEFEPQSRWSKKAYKPMHLLDLQQLVETAKKRGG
jgi:ribulose bisphosphate carboxylase small subunit